MQASDFKTYKALGATIYVCELTGADTSSRLQSQLPYKFDVSHIGSEARRRELIGIRLMCCALWGNDARVEYANSRPTVVLPFGNVAHISVAHSHGVLAVAYHNDSAIGIDIEVFGKKMGRVRTRFLSPVELAWQADDDERLTKAHLSWTLKESLYKIVGDPVYDFPQKIEVSSDFSYVVALGNKYSARCWTTDRYALSLVRDLL